MKKIAILPTLLTLGNGVCGFASIAWASKIGTPMGEGDTALTCFAVAGWLLVAAMVFDALDGFAARRTKTASKFGGELDSLCDAISFGVAPAFLLLKLGPGWEQPIQHQLVAGIAALYMVCAVLRLARFNVDNTPDPSGHKRFKGLPSPGAAGCVASLAVLRGELPAKLALQWADVSPHFVPHLLEVIAPVGAFLVALLMVSNIPYPHATGKLLRGRRRFGHLLQVLFLVFVVVLFREVALATIFWVYAMVFPLRYLALRRLRSEQPIVSTVDEPRRRS